MERPVAYVDARRFLQIIADGGHCRKPFGVTFAGANLKAVFSLEHAPIISNSDVVHTIAHFADFRKCEYSQYVFLLFNLL